MFWSNSPDIAIAIAMVILTVKVLVIAIGIGIVVVVVIVICYSYSYNCVPVYYPKIRWAIVSASVVSQACKVSWASDRSF